MPRVSDLLDRLRPAGAPGPAGAVGVPADRRAAAERELAPVFTALAATLREAAGIRAAAADRATEVERRAAEQATAVIAHARASVGAERARVAARVRANAQTELAELAAQSAAKADAVRQTLRALAGWFEIANVDRQLLAWAGGPATHPYRLGMLATAWPRLAMAGSPGELPTALSTSAWGDPGGASGGRYLALPCRYRPRVVGYSVTVIWRPLGCGAVSGTVTSRIPLWYLAVMCSASALAGSRTARCSRP
jgi:hypothetical protein